MNHSTKLMSLFGVGAIIFAGMAGCTKEGAQEAGQAVEGAGKAVSNTTEAAGNQLEGAGNAVENGLKGAGNAIDNTGKAVSNSVSAGVGKLNTPKLKAAIAANPVGKNIKDLNVDTSGDTITLSGTGSAAAKNVAGQIAKKEAIGYKIVNNIKAQ